MYYFGDIELIARIVFELQCIDLGFKLHSTDIRRVGFDSIESVIIILYIY